MPTHRFPSRCYDGMYLAVHPPSNIFTGPVPDIQRSVIGWVTGIPHSLQQTQNGKGVMKCVLRMGALALTAQGPRQVES